MREGIALDLGALIAGARGAQREKDGNGFDTTISNEAQIARLQEAAGDYADARRQCPFKVGDIVTPRPQYGTKGVGAPHIVVDVLQPHDVKPNFAGANSSSLHYGTRSDMRVLCMLDDSTMAAFWGESYQYEKYEG